MYSAIFIANEYVDLAIKDKTTLTNMKLQKLIYIANGINLAKNDEPLIIEHVEVWPYGPVVSSVYHQYKMFGNSKITKFEIPDYYQDDLLGTSLNSFREAWDIAKGINAIKLSNWTHNPDSPWSRAKSEGLSVIPDDYMKEFFQRFLNA